MVCCDLYFFLSLLALPSEEVCHSVFELVASVNLHSLLSSMRCFIVICCQMLGGYQGSTGNPCHRSCRYIMSEPFQILPDTPDHGGMMHLMGDPKHYCSAIGHVMQLAKS